MIPYFIDWQREGLELYARELAGRVSIGAIDHQEATDMFAREAEKLAGDVFEFLKFMRLMGIIRAALPPRDPNEPPQVLVVTSPGVRAIYDTICAGCSMPQEARPSECPKGCPGACPNCSRVSPLIGPCPTCRDRGEKQRVLVTT